MSDVKGCPICEGKESKAWSDKRCEAHDVCDDCGIKRKDVIGKSVWGTCNNFRCIPCEEKRKQEKYDNFQAKHQEEDEFYDDRGAICPHCGNLNEPDCDSDYYEDGEHDKQCDDCRKDFKLNTSILFTYYTTKT